MKILGGYAQLYTQILRINMTRNIEDLTRENEELKIENKELKEAGIKKYLETDRIFKKANKLADENEELKVSCASLNEMHESIVEKNRELEEKLKWCKMMLKQFGDAWERRNNETTPKMDSTTLCRCSCRHNCMA